MGEAQQDQGHDDPLAGTGGPAPTARPGGVATSAFRAARGVLEAAEAEAAAIIAEAERRARSREREAEMLVAKARRVLEVAEAKAAAIVAARPEAAVVDLTDGPRRVVAPDATLLRGSLEARVDEIVATAVAQAVSEAARPGVVGSAS